MPPRKSAEKSAAERSLPTTKNDLMVGELDPAVLRTKCRVQDVRFGPDDEGVTETFVRIKTQIPGTNMPHFIMRKAQDDYVSATSMYRAVFYTSTKSQEENEMKVVRRELAARSDENASGVWIPGAPDALQLADVYGIRSWVQALLDAPTTKAAYPEEQRSPSHRTPSAVNASTPNPPSSSSVAPTPSRKSTRERSQSPRKSVAASARKVRKVVKEAVETIAEDAGEVAETVQKAVSPVVAKKAESKRSPRANSSPASKPSAQVSELAEAVASGEDAVVYAAKVADEGQSITDMVAQARAQVEAAQAQDAKALAKSGLSPGRSGGKKRELEVDAEDAIQDQIVSIKRGRVEELEVGLVQEKRKVRALFGLVIGLGATAILPYIL